MYGTPQQRIQRFFNSAGCPVTVLLIVANIITFFVINGGQTPVPYQMLGFHGDSWLQQVWTPITWPLVGIGDPINILFACFWAFWVCGSLERSWGTRTFALFFAAVSALMALTVLAGGQILHRPVELAGLWLGLAAPTIAWCTINKRESISLFGVLSIPSPLLAALTLVMVWYEVGPPLMGLFALSGCVAAYWYVSKGRYAYRGYAGSGSSGGPRKAPVLHLRDFGQSSEREAIGGFAPLRWWKARQERRKLEQLWKRSNEQDNPRP